MTCLRWQLPGIEEVDRSKLCEGKNLPCDLCKSLKEICLFKIKHLSEVHKKKYYNCNSKICFYLIECQVCGEQHTGSMENNFWSRARNGKSTHLVSPKVYKFKKKKRK